jgi:RHS repeat-associated protein
MDDGNGLYFMRSRYYAPGLMRFLERDRAARGSLTDTQSLNGYAYVGGNPILRTDPSGEFWNVVVGAVVGAAVNVAIQATVDIVNGEFSGWDTYAGAAVEGAVAGAFAGSGVGWLTVLGAGVGALAGDVAAGEDLDLAEAGLAAGTAGLGHGAGKLWSKHLAKKAGKLQSLGKAQELQELLGKQAMKGYRGLYGDLFKLGKLNPGNLSKLMSSPAVRKQVLGEFLSGWGVGVAPTVKAEIGW